MLQQSDLEALFLRVQSTPVLVIGDLILDEYHWCSVDRLSPEAPVPVCRIERTSYVPGGAANVAHNVKTLGGDCYVSGLVGQDEGGGRLKHLLVDKGIHTEAVVEDEKETTTIKSRIIARHQHVVRVDRESNSQPVGEETCGLEKILELMAGPIKAVLISDYAKGFLNADNLSVVIETASKQGIPVIIDPKGVDYDRYKGCYVITPNFKEFQAAVQHPLETESDIEREGHKLRELLDCHAIVLTRSEQGMSIFSEDGTKVDIPTQAKEVSDITGAGDTVVASLGLFIAAGIGLENAVRLANYAAGLVVGKVGTATVSQSDILNAL